MDELNKIFGQEYNTLYEDWDNQDYILNADTPLEIIGNLKIWQLAGCFLLSTILLVFIIFLLIKFSCKYNPEKSDLEDLENLYKYSMTGKSLRQTDKKIFHITKQVCFLTNELNKSKKLALQLKHKNKEVVLKPESRVVLDKELLKNPDSFA